MTDPGATFHIPSDITRPAVCLQEHMAREAGTHTQKAENSAQHAWRLQVVYAKFNYY